MSVEAPRPTERQAATKRERRPLPQPLQNVLVAAGVVDQYIKDVKEQAHREADGKQPKIREYIKAGAQNALFVREALKTAVRGERSKQHEKAEPPKGERGGQSTETRKQEEKKQEEQEALSTLVTAPVARLLAVTMCPDRPEIGRPDFFLNTTEIKDRETLADLQQRIITQTGNKELDYTSIQELSLASRCAYWQHQPERTFQAQNKRWNKAYTALLQQYTEQNGDIEQEQAAKERRQALRSVHLDIDSPAFSQTRGGLNVLVEDFRQRYFKGGSNVKQFVADIADDCRNGPDQPVNLAQLRTRLDAVSECFDCFGRNVTDKEGQEHRVNKHVEEYLVTHSLLTQTSPDIKTQIAEHVIREITKIPQTEIATSGKRPFPERDFQREQGTEQEGTPEAQIFTREPTEPTATAADKKKDHTKSLPTQAQQEEQVPGEITQEPLIQPSASLPITATSRLRRAWLPGVRYGLLKGNKPRNTKDTEPQAMPESQIFTKESTAATDETKERVLVADAGGRSEKSRENDNWGTANQDAYFISRDHGAFGVFDGLGQGVFSEKASHGVSEYLNKVLADPGLNSLSFEDTKKYVEEQIEKANEVISEITHRSVLDQMKGELEAKEGQELTDEEIDKRYTDDELQAKYDEILNSQYRSGKYKVKIGTTASVVKIWEGEEAGERKKKAILANVGDSRIYRLRQGSLELLTLDDTRLRDVLDYKDAKRVQDTRATISKWDCEDKKIMVKATTPERVEILNERFDRRGFIPFVLDEEREMSVGKLDFSGFGQTQIMGVDEIEPRMDTIDLLPGDRLIITSDGVHDQLKLPTIARVVNEHAGAQAAANALVKQTAKERGNLVDDTTAVVINI